MRIFFWFLFLLFLSALSYFRETVFLGINEIIEQNLSDHPYTFKPTFLFQFTVAELTKLKYLLTAIFTLIFTVLSLFGLHIGFKDKLAYQIALFAYTISFIFLIIAALSGIILFDFSQVYPFIRSIIGYVHSPIPYLIISISALVANFYKLEH